MSNIGFHNTLPPIDQRSFLLTKSSNQSHSASALTKLTFDSIDNDWLGRDWSIDHSEYRPSNAGIYGFTVEVDSTYVASVPLKIVAIYVNGVEAVRVLHEDTKRLGSNITSAPLYLDVDDLVEFYASISSSGSFTTNTQVRVHRLF